MEESFWFEVSEMQQTDSKVLQLRELISIVGGMVEIREQKGKHLLYINIDMDKFQRVTKRNAGRYKAYDKAEEKYLLNPTIAEVMRWKETMTHQQIIEKIGCPRATYYRAYRRIKEGKYTLNEVLLDNEINSKFFG